MRSSRLVCRASGARLLGEAIALGGLLLSMPAHAQDKAPEPQPFPPAAQPAEPPAPQPTEPAPQPAPPPPAPAQPPAGWGTPPNPGYAPPINAPPEGPPPQGYSPYGYGAFPPPGPPPPPLQPKKPSCCRFAIRFDPFDLLFRRLSFQAELGIWGPIAIEAEPQWIFAAATENLDTTGGALQGNLLVYFTGHALNGFYAKATVGFEKYTATLTDPQLQQTSTAEIASPILGLGVGSSNVFGEEYGFNLSGGVGIGFATAEKKVLTAGQYEVDFYDKASIVQLLASLGLGFAF